MATIYGGAGHNVIFETGNSDYIYGGAGFDTIHTSVGRDIVYGGDDVDMLIVNWGTATDDIFFYAQSSTYGYVNDVTSSSNSTRYVDFELIEHLNITGGSGNDYIEGINNSTDTINGRAGVDLWDDSFAGLTTAITVDMSLVSSGSGQFLSDGSFVRNVERVNLGLSQGNDVFSDFGTYNDAVYGGLGNDTLGTSAGRDLLYGGTGVDTLIVNWATATNNSYFYAQSSTYGYVNTNTSSSNSMRYVDHETMEHLMMTAGSGDDYLEGFLSAWDTIDGGGGTDLWDDSFSALTAGMYVNMANVSSATGQSWADGSHVRNVERVNLNLTQGNDTFRDEGTYNDVVYGLVGNDNLGTSAGRDLVYGGAGDDRVNVNWSDATQNVYFYAQSSTYGYVNTNTSSSNSTRYVDHETMEHVVMTSGAGDDYLEGFNNSWDYINGGGGTDLWDDSFSGLSTGMFVNMANVSSATGQSWADGSHVRNVERVNLNLTQGNDTFRDEGTYNDVVYGLVGNDNLGTSAGRDLVYGGAGDDRVNVNWSDATQNVYFYAQSSTYGYVNTNTSSSNSTRYVDHETMEHVVMTSGAGDDYLEGFNNSWDYINGGGGTDLWDDSFSTASAGMAIYMSMVQSATGQSWADTSHVRNVERVNLSLTGFNDTFRDAGTYNDVIYAGAGNDDLGHTAGRDLLYGGDGIDTVRLFWGDATQDIYIYNSSSTYAYVNTHTSSSNSTRYVDYENVENVIAYLGTGNDTVHSGAADDFFQGGAGADYINGGAGSDTASYATSNAAVTISLAANTATGGHATGDTLVSIENLVGSGYGDTLIGDANSNNLFGGNGNDTLYGWGNNDTITGGNGQDLAYLGDGNDRFIDNGQGATTGNDTVYGQNGYDVIIGGGGNDSFYGGNGNDTLYGAADNDLLAGGAGADRLQGGEGNDRLFGGSGADLLYGGNGTDAANYNGSSVGAVANLSNSAANAGAALGDTFSSIENLVGTAHADVLTGDSGANVLVGLGGTDSLFGGGGEDVLNGGVGDDLIGGGDGNDIVVGSNGNDSVYGGNGNDTLFGGGGNDYLLGGSGKDTLNGGVGTDVFDFNAVSQSSAGANRDVVQGFSSAASDIVDLQTIDANNLLAGNQAFVFVGGAGFSGAAGQLRFVAAGGNGYLSGDVNGDMVADITIEFTGLTSMAASDIIL